jgi:peptide subunit release factor 1 (eRF1)
MLTNQQLDSEIEVREHGRQDRRGLLDLLRYLSALDGSASEIVSLYIDSRWSDEHQRDRVSLELRRRIEAELARRPDDQALNQEMNDVRLFIDAHVRQMEDVGYAGVALFRCRRLGLDLALRGAASLPTLLEVGPVPILRPLVGALRGRERAILALVDTNSARLYEFGLGDFGPTNVLIGEVPKRHKRGGWSQLHFQHHRAEHVAALHREAAQATRRLLDVAPGALLLMGGLQEAIANFQHLLPSRLAGRILLVDGIDMHSPEHEVLLQAERRLIAAADWENREALEEIRGLALAGGRAVLGLAEVVKSLNQGRVLRTLVGDELPMMLSRCPQCGDVALDSVKECTSCGRSLLIMQASEAITHAALSTRARIDLVPLELIAPHGGAAAALRF